MNLWKSMGGMIQGQIISADCAGTLQRITRQGIMLYRVEKEDDLTIRFLLNRQDWKTLKQLCDKRGDQLHLLEKKGLFWSGTSLVRRPVLLFGVAFLFFLTLWLPTRVLFVEVEGNKTIADRQILEAAETCGIRFGASRRAVRSEKMKNALLEEVEGLKWAGINTYGCRAVISVRERQQEMKTSSEGITGIVASRDAYVTECTVTGGTGLCQPGQTVRQGQLLISPYTDCGLCIRVERAEGEIMAQTRRKIHAVTPAQTLIRSHKEDQSVKVSLFFGKKRINLWKGSGIWDATCGRIYKEYSITLPGGFCLPIRIGLETVTHCQTGVQPMGQEDAEKELTSFAQQYVASQMIAGRILNGSHSFSPEAGRYELKGEYLCSEMIGRENRLQIGETNEQTG